MERKIITVSPSSLNSIQSCLYQYYLGHIEGWKPEGEKSASLEKGSLFHLLLEYYYKGIQADITVNRQQLGEVCIEIARSKALEMSLDTEDVQKITDAFRLYIVNYMGENLQPLAVEAPFSYNLYEDEKYQILFEGKIDLLPQIGEQKFVMDHKTEKSHHEPKQLDNQFIGYSAVTGLNGIIVNQITLTKSPQFHRTILNYSPQFIQEWKNTTIEWILTMLHYVENKNFPQNFKSCWGCHFSEVCKQDYSNHKGVLEQLYKKRENYDIFGS